MLEHALVDYYQMMEVFLLFAEYIFPDRIGFQNALKACKKIAVQAHLILDQIHVLLIAWMQQWQSLSLIHIS